jgi:hypothetical protein
LVPLLILVVLALLAVAAPAWGTSMPARSTAASTDFIPFAAGISFALDQARSRVSVEASSCASTTAVAARPGFRLLLDRSWEHVPPENERDRPLPRQLRGFLFAATAAPDLLNVG